MEKEILAKAENEARRLIAAHLNGWTFQWARRSTSRLGTCDARKRLVLLNPLHVLHDSGDDVKDTILHEIAHALAWEAHGRAAWNHGPLWKAWAVKVGARPHLSKETKIPQPIRKRREGQDFGAWRIAAMKAAKAKARNRVL